MLRLSSLAIFSLGVTVWLFAPIESVLLNAKAEESEPRLGDAGHTRLDRLIRSPRVNDLRAAVRIIESYPKESEAVLSIVVKRSNHPELTGICDQMLNRASEQQLLTQLRKFDPKEFPWIHKRVQAALRSRGDLRPKSRNPTLTAKSRIAMTKPPPAQRSVEKPNSSHVPVQVIESTASKVDAASQKAALGRFAEISKLPVEAGLNGADWAFLFREADQDFPEKDFAGRNVAGRNVAGQNFASQDPTRSLTASMAADLVKKYAATDIAKVVQYAASSSTRHPERFIPAILRSAPIALESVTCMREFAKRADKEIDLAIAEHFPRTKENVDQHELVLTTLGDRYILETNDRDAYTIQDFVYRSTIAATPATRKRLIKWYLSKLQSDLLTSKPGGQSSDDNSLMTSRVSQVLYSISRNEQLEHVDDLIHHAKTGPTPWPYIRILSQLKCNLSPAASWLRELHHSTSDTVRRLRVAKVLCQATGQSSEVWPEFRDAIQHPDSSDRVLQTAMSGVMTIGPRASPLVPRLIELLETPARKNLQPTVIRTIGKIGPGAKKSTPALIRAMTTANEGWLDLEVIKVLPMIQSDPADIVPTLTRIAEDTAQRYQKSIVPRTLAIHQLKEFGPSAATALPALIRLSESENHSIARSATEAIKKITEVR